jgi:hypothetical protein
MMNGSITNAAHWMSLESWKENLLTKLSSKETCLTSAFPFLSNLWHQYHQFYSGAVSGIENKHLIKIWDMYGSKI